MSPVTRSTHFSIPAGQENAPNGQYDLGATLDLPADISAERLREGAVPTAIVVACFTCARSAVGVTRISKTLAKHGIASLRIDLAGLGTSGGDFAKSSLDTNVADVIAATQWLEDNAKSPSLLVGHSLGGCAVVRAASQVDSVRAIATVGTPFDPRHVKDSIPEVAAILDTASQESAISTDAVEIPGRGVAVGADFFRVLRCADPAADMEELKSHDVVHLALHSPHDEVVDYQEGLAYINHPSRISSLIALPEADHLLQRRGSGQRVGEIISTWARPHLN